MFCNSCGEALAHNSGFCTRCGARMAGSTSNAPPPAAVARVPRTYVEPRGVGGWLLFFWISLVLSVFAYLIAALHSRLPLVGAIEIGMATIGAFLAFYTWQENPKALDLLNAIFLVSVIRAGLVVLIAYHHLSFRVTNPGRLSDYTIAAVTLFRVTAWWLYFHSSVRVRNTFGRNL